MAEPEGKGSGFIGLLNTLRAMVPEDAYARLVRSVPEDTAELMRKPPLPVAWIPSRHFYEVLEAAARQIFGGDESQVSEVGRRALHADLKGVYRMFVRLLSPGWVIERGTRLWETYSRNNGRLRAVSVDDHTCDVVYEDLPAKFMTPAYWAYQRGCVRAAIEVTGMKNVAVETRAGGGRENHCTLRVRWS